MWIVPSAALQPIPFLIIHLHHPAMMTRYGWGVVRAHLAPSFAKWWLPDEVIIVASIPRSGTGKYLKNVLREEFRDRLTVFAASGSPASDQSATSPG